MTQHLSSLLPLLEAFVSKGVSPLGPLVSKGASSVPDPPFVSEGAQNVDFSPDFDVVPAQTRTSEGVSTSTAQTCASEGVSTSTIPSPACEGDDLRMLTMVNLETAGLHRSSRVRSKSLRAQEADRTKEVTLLSQYSLFSYLGGDCLISALSVNHIGYKSLTVSPDSSFFS